MEKEKNVVRIDENRLKAMVMEAIVSAADDVMQESDMDEGFWNQLKTGAKTFTGKNKGSLGDRWNSAKKNYQIQGRVDGMDDVIKGLQKLMDQGLVKGNTTVDQILASNSGKFNSFSGVKRNLQGQMRRNGMPKAQA